MEFFLLVFPSWMSNFNGVIEKKVIKEENLWVYLFGFVVLWLGVWSYVRMVFAKSSPTAAQPSPFTAAAAAAKSLHTVVAQLAPSTAAAQPAAPIPIVVDDVVSPSPTTSGGACHTPSFFDNSMDVKDNEHEIGDGHRGSVRNTGSMGRGGRPPSYKRAKTVSKPSAAWEHFTRDETSSQDEPMAYCNYCGIRYKCHPKVNGTSSMLYHVGNCAQYKSLKARQDKSQTKFTFEAKGGEGNALMIAKYDEKKKMHLLK
jgi:hypothetical protein